jgi:tetratricopeptide (TPR) repeat protein
METSESHTGLTRQEGPSGEPGFAFMYAPEGTEERAGKVAEEKYAKARAVYERLLRARGDLRRQPPPFVMRRRERYVAWLDPRGPEIGLEEKAYDVCAAFEEDVENVIAALMGHELTHYYEKHDWRRHFVSQYSELEVGKDLGALDDARHNEAQADYLGGLLAYSAGYDPFGRMPELLDKLYTAYGLGSELPGYPSLAERKAMALGAQARLRELVRAFNMANYLIAIGAYGVALDYFNYILKEYQSRELYNNAGVCAFLAALDYFTDTELQFFYPVELDMEGRSGGKGSPGDAGRIRQELLEQAVAHFQYAAALDEDYAPAQLNLGCAYTLLGDYPRARYRAGVEAIQLAEAQQDQKVLADCYTLLGIIAAREGKGKEAGGYFDQAVDLGSTMAAHNKAVLQGKKKADKQTGPIAQTLVQERLDGISLQQFAQDPTADDDSEMPISETHTFYVKSWPGKASRIFIDISEEQYIFIHLPDPGYDGETSKGIRRGDDRTKVIDAYGTPARTIELTSGQLIVFDKIFFEFDREGKVKRWGLYLVE